MRDYVYLEKQQLNALGDYSSNIAFEQTVYEAFFQKKRFLIKPWKVKKAIGKEKLEKKSELLAIGLEKH